MKRCKIEHLTFTR